MTKTGIDPYSNGPNFPLSNEKNFPYSIYAEYNLTRQFLKVITNQESQYQLV